MKLENYGIQGPTLKWLKDFLLQRRQKVVINGVTSGWANVNSGVPQGSVLGPALFVVYINDMPEVVHNYILLFADDSKIFSKIHGLEDHLKLQTDLQELQNWSDKWQLKFNIEKCKVMHLGAKNPRYTYTMDGKTLLESIDHEKDLGVTIDRDLKLSLHYSLQVNKAN